MDLNQLYHNHQLALMRAQDPDKVGTRHQALGHARTIAGEIAAFQEGKGADAASTWRAQSARPGAALCSALTMREFAS